MRVETMTFAILVQCSISRGNKLTTGSGSFCWAVITNSWVMNNKMFVGSKFPLVVQYSTGYWRIQIAEGNQSKCLCITRGFNTNQQNVQLPVGLIAQLVFISGSDGKCNLPHCKRKDWGQIENNHYYTHLCSAWIADFPCEPGETNITNDGYLE